MNDDLSRRAFMTAMAGCAAAIATGCTDPTESPFFRKNFRDMSDDEKKSLLADLEKAWADKLGKEVTISGQGPHPTARFGYALDLSRCIGCRRCVHACVAENNQSHDPEIQWIRVLQMDKQKGIDFAHATPYYDPEKVPEDGHFYVPMACQQCENPSCVQSCPTGATWRDEDGIVVVDYDWCIGCRCCMSACPDGARRVNRAPPERSADSVNPDMHYLGNRPRTRGVVEKCTWCIHRVRNGRYPACVEVCPVGARKFGDLGDPASEIRYILEHKRVFVLKVELNTRPRFFFYYG
jgi:molybdopterin-containing oxidoreductase family iron-sulfur binding subunit